MNKTLDELLENVLVTNSIHYKNHTITGVTANSKHAKPGDLFVAVVGLTNDAHQYIPQVINQGVTVVVGQHELSNLPFSIPESVTYITVPDSRKALGLIVANYYDNPSDSLTVIGVTGTDGKTTTCHMIYAVLRKTYSVGMITTLGAYINGVLIDTGLHVTSPDAPVVQALLHKMKEGGVTHVVLEVTSHGLHQDRFSGVKFDVGVLTNITHEHLDYHKTFDNYLQAKMILLRNAKHVVLNADDPSFKNVRSEIKNKSMTTYAIKAQADFVAFNISFDTGISFSVKNNAVTYTVSSKAVGQFNVFNALAAIAVARTFSVPWKNIVSSLKSFKSPKGRVEEIKNEKGLRIFVDFAHTPNGLQHILQALRVKTPKEHKLIVVFGSAGERDREKRLLMGEVAGTYADLSVITTEDPRSESIHEIAQSIQKGIEKVNGKYVVQLDRGQAIYDSIHKHADRGDTIVICGKGHEKSMAFGKTEIPWSDQRAIKSALKMKALHTPVN